MTVVDGGPAPTREIDNLWIPMPDGARLAARAWLPADAERRPVPAIVDYIPYRKRDGTVWRDAVTQPYIASHGYAVLRIDLRGTGDSDGVLTDEYTLQEHEDALAALTWIAAQPWCTGRIGMIGVSWGGFNALQIAARRPPELGAIITICASDDRYCDDAHYMGGCVLNEHVVWGVAILAQAALPPDPLIVGERWRDMWIERLAATPPWVARWLAHQRRDDYWKHGSVSEDHAAIRCPVYAVGGWADAYRNSVPRLLTKLSVPSKGLVGPWTHGWPHLGEPEPAIGFLQESIRWWDHWLKGRDTGIMDEMRYRVWMPGPASASLGVAHGLGRWVAEPAWPSAAIVPHRFHLDAGRLVETSESEVALSHGSPETNGRAAGAWCPYHVGDLPGDQRDDDAQSLVFDTPPLTESFEILGAPALEIELTSDRAVALLVARLCDVDEQGVSTRVTYGVLNLTHRRSHAEPSPLMPGQRTRVRLQLNDIAHAFAAGHRLRLALSTSYWPIVWPSPEPVMLTLFTGPTSALTLPLRPARTSDAALSPFGPPERAGEPAMSMIEPGQVSSDATLDESTGMLALNNTYDNGLERFDDIDLAVGTAIREVYEIAAGDPRTAKAGLTWTIRRERPGWHIRIEAQIDLSCTESSFIVAQSLQAFENGVRVFARDWRDSLARDLV